MMKEAGYEWDADKKELNNIEQKPAEWSEEDKLSEIAERNRQPYQTSQRHDWKKSGRKQEEKEMKCSKCKYLNWDFLTDKIEQTDEDFCGLHGRARVQIDGVQQDFNHHGGCGFVERQKFIQLDLF